MHSVPKVTALLPAYNAAGFVQRTLDSLSVQTWPNLEILIADDHSSDGTLAIVERFAAGRDNVRVLARSKNLGWLANCNDMMSRASGELMFFAFHDDVVAPRYVESLATALVARPQATLAYSDLELVTTEGVRSEEIFTALDGAHTTLQRGLVMARSPHNWWVPNRGVFRASAFSRIGGMKPHAAGEYSADWPWLLHLALLGSFVRVPGLLVRKHFEKTSLSRSWANDRSQRRALRHAGVREVWHSELDVATRSALAAYMGLNVPKWKGQLARLYQQLVDKPR